ncbi:shugoshin 2 [Ctenodactylus gundi]
MEYPVVQANSLASSIKRQVKDKRISKTKLNVSLASKIKTKIINNSSIFKISLKHNNRALAQALSREKENSRRITTEKMLLQKEVEKLNFENTFLRVKLNNLNKKLIEIESLINNSLLTAIEMSSLSEFHQSSFLLPSSKKRRTNRQSRLMRPPFARVPLPSDDDDDDDEKEKVCHGNSVTSGASPALPSVVSVRPTLSSWHHLEELFPKEKQNTSGLDDLEHPSSPVNTLPKDNGKHPACHDSSKIDEKLGQKIGESAEMVAHISQMCDGADTGRHNLEKGLPDLDAPQAQNGGVGAPVTSFFPYAVCPVSCIWYSRLLLTERPSIMCDRSGSSIYLLEDEEVK